MPGKLFPRDWIGATLPKPGHRPEENEDALAASPERNRFAVADGATEGWESGAWSAHLAGAFIRRAPTPADFPGWLAEAQRTWRPRTVSASPAWYAVEKQEQGSFATLIGLELCPPKSELDTWRWKAVAVGDSCLIQVRAERIESTFPLSREDEFTDRPALVPSSSSLACPAPAWLAGHAEASDLLVLASDAAACRLFQPSAFDSALRAIRTALDGADPTPLVDWLRGIQESANDDATVAAIRMPAAGEAA
jgi:hypothetical protein